MLFRSLEFKYSAYSDFDHGESAMRINFKAWKDIYCKWFLPYMGMKLLLTSLIADWRYPSPSQNRENPALGWNGTGLATSAPGPLKNSIFGSGRIGIDTYNLREPLLAAR